MTGVNCIVALKALGEETRMRILRMLFQEELSVTTIAKRLHVSQYNVSKHLRIMREAGLLESRKHGQERLYGVVKSLKAKASGNGTLDLGCCLFRIEKIAK